MASSNSNGLETDGCCRCQKTEASIECSDCIVDNECSLYCDDCYTIVHKGGLSKHTCVTLTAKLLSEIESKGHTLETTLNIDRLRMSIQTECERQKAEIDLHLSQAQNEVKTLCNVLRNTIDTQETTLMLNISQIRNVRQTELEDVRSHSIQSLHETERQMRDTLERLKLVTPQTPKLDLLRIEHQLEVVTRNGHIETPILPCVTCVSLPDTKRIEKTLINFLTTMPITNLWKINISRDVKLVYIQENSCRFFLMDRQQSQDQVSQTVLYYHFRIHDSIRYNISPIAAPDVGQLCIIVSKNNCLMRAIIEGVSDDKNKMKVFYLDIGESGIVDNSQKSCVFPLDDKLLFYPFTCYYCQIDLDYDEHDKTIERQIRWFLRDLTQRDNGLTASLKRKEFLKSGIALHCIQLKDNSSAPDSDPLMTQLQDRVDKAGIGKLKTDNFKYQDIRVVNSHETGPPAPPAPPAPPMKNPVQIDPSLGYPSDISIVQYPTFRTAMPFVPNYGYQPAQQMPSIYYPGYLPMTAVRAHHTPPSTGDQIVSSPRPHSPPAVVETSENRPRVPVGAKAVTNSVTEDNSEETSRNQQESSPDGLNYENVELVVEKLDWDENAWEELKNIQSSFWKIELNSTIFMKLATTLSKNGTFWALQQHAQEFRMETFDHLFDQLQSYAEQYNSPNKQSIKIGSLCAAQFYLDKKWYRALVEYLEEGKRARVRFLDYGNSQITQLEHLLHLPPQFCQLPFQAILCSMNFTTDVILTKPRRDRFAELLDDDRVKNFSSVVKHIEGPIHVVNITKFNPDKPDVKMDINEEVFLSDLHVPDMEPTGKSWADAMKSPNSPETKHVFPTSSASSERTHPMLKSQQQDIPEEIGEKRQEQTGRATDYTGTSARSTYQDRSRDQDNEYQRGGGGGGGGYHHQLQQPNRYQSYQDRNNWGQGGQNWRSNESWKGDYNRPRGTSGPYPVCSPSLYIKCDFFSNNSPAFVNKTMVDILKGFQDSVTHIVPDTRSGGPILFLDVDTHKNALDVMYFLNNEVKHIENHDLRAELAKRYKQYLEMSK